MNFFIKFLATLAIKFCDLTGRTHHITGNGTELYLVRYILVKNRFFSIFIHRFMRSDDPIPHDHPWNFFTYVISGGYKEHFYDRSKPTVRRRQLTKLWSETLIHRRPGSLRYRSANAVHWVETDRTYSLEEIESAPLTVCLIGPRVKEWGYWVEDTTYVDWREFLKIRNTSDPRIYGSE